MKITILNCLSLVVLFLSMAGPGSGRGITSENPVTSPEIAFTSSTNKVTTKPTAKTPPYCGNDTNHTGDVAFTKTSPMLTRVKEGSEFKLRCTYCLVGEANSSQNWYNRHGEIVNNDEHAISGDNLEIQKAKLDVDEGWYECVVWTSAHNISTLFTVLVDKDENNPIMTSVEATNMTSTSVLIQWTLQRHPYVITRIKLHLRKLTSKEWSHSVEKVTKNTDLHFFKKLEPETVYILHVEVIINSVMEEKKTMVFNTAPVNYTFAYNKTRVIYYATNREAMGIAFGIVALMACVFGFCACYLWCYDDKRDYITPTNQQWDDEPFQMEQLYHEKESLCTTGVHYNRAFDEGADNDWEIHIEESL